MQNLQKIYNEKGKKIYLFSKKSCNPLDKTAFFSI